MPTPYRPRRPESGTLAPALSHVAEAVQEHLDDAGLSATARTIGVPKSSLHRWGATLPAWDGAALLTLGRTSPTVGAAIVALIQGQAAPAAEPTAAIPEAYKTGRLASDLIEEIMSDIEDGQFDRAEQRRLDAKIDAIASLLVKFKRDVKAATR